MVNEKRFRASLCNYRSFNSLCNFIYNFWCSMKFWNLGNVGALLMMDSGEVRVAQNRREIMVMMNRVAPNPKLWTSETIQCAVCEATWCEIHRHVTSEITCPECKTELKLL